MINRRYVIDRQRAALAARWSITKEKRNEWKQ